MIKCKGSGFCYSSPVSVVPFILAYNYLISSKNGKFCFLDDSSGPN